MNTTDRILGEAVRPPTHEELTDPPEAYDYARNVIKDRWPEGEPAIATSPQWAYYYAIDVIEGPFPEGEAAIATDPWPAYAYATDVLKHRWPEGEPVIARDPHYSTKYFKQFPEAKLEWVLNGLMDWTDL